MKLNRHQILVCAALVLGGAVVLVARDHIAIRPKHAAVPELYSLHTNDTEDWIWAFEPFGPNGEQLWAQRYFATREQAIEDAWAFEKNRTQPVKKKPSPK
ncbi:MAG: hypothetical protein NTY53_14345 [Kiritimatiellaeota bacterium]|nr:hypothetical protein [Kiritimatiellota bacterium]